MIALAAKSIPGLNPRQLFAVRHAASVEGEASSFDHEATADKVTGTPTLFVGKSGRRGKRVPLANPTDERSLVKAIQAALAS